MEFILTGSDKGQKEYSSGVNSFGIHAIFLEYMHNSDEGPKMVKCLRKVLHNADEGPNRVKQPKKNSS
jgi:hypothetical protein